MALHKHTHITKPSENTVIIKLFHPKSFLAEDRFASWKTILFIATSFARCLPDRPASFFSFTVAAERDLWMNERENPSLTQAVSGSGLPDDSHSVDSADFYEEAAPRNVVYIPETRGTMWLRRLESMSLCCLPCAVAGFSSGRENFLRNETKFQSKQREKGKQWSKINFLNDCTERISIMGLLENVGYWETSERLLCSSVPRKKKIKASDREKEKNNKHRTHFYTAHHGENVQSF